VCDV